MAQRTCKRFEGRLHNVVRVPARQLHGSKHADEGGSGIDRRRARVAAGRRLFEALLEHATAALWPPSVQFLHPTATSQHPPRIRCQSATACSTGPTHLTDVQRHARGVDEGLEEVLHQLRLVLAYPLGGQGQVAAAAERKRGTGRGPQAGALQHDSSGDLGAQPCTLACSARRCTWLDPAGYHCCGRCWCLFLSCLRCGRPDRSSTTCTKASSSGAAKRGQGMGGMTHSWAWQQAAPKAPPFYPRTDPGRAPSAPCKPPLRLPPAPAPPHR